MFDNPHVIKLSIVFKHTDPSDALRDYVSEKLTNCLQKFVHHDTEAHVVLKVEKNRKIAEIAFHADGADFACKEENDDFYVAADALVGALSHQLRKHKERITKHH